VISPLKKSILQTLTDIYELADDVRFGQLMANLSFIGESETDKSVWDIEDEEMLEVLHRHRDDLQNLRQAREQRA